MNQNQNLTSKSSKSSNWFRKVFIWHHAILSTYNRTILPIHSVLDLKGLHLDSAWIFKAAVTR